MVVSERLGTEGTYLLPLLGREHPKNWKHPLSVILYNLMICRVYKPYTCLIASRYVP